MFLSSSVAIYRALCCLTQTCFVVLHVPGDTFDVRRRRRGENRLNRWRQWQHARGRGEVVPLRLYPCKRGRSDVEIRYVIRFPLPMFMILSTVVPVHSMLSETPAVQTVSGAVDLLLRNCRCSKYLRFCWYWFTVNTSSLLQVFRLLPVLVCCSESQPCYRCMLRCCR